MPHRVRARLWVAGLLGAVAAGGAASPPALGAQQQDRTGTIQGTVYQSGSRRPLQAATVQIVGSQAGAITDANGQYRLLNVAPGRRELRARLIGHTPAAQAVEVAAGQTAVVNFSLEQSALQLSEVVVTGVGGVAAEKRTQGNTVGVIQPPPDAPITKFSDVLQGREPGVVGLPSSGLTGEGTRIRIRGNASLSQSNEPIVYIDGVRMNNGGGFGGFVGTGGGGQPSRLDDIDPTTIERIEVLKGAAAATLYGTEASNGVIQIFTKRGTTGAPKWLLQTEQAAIAYPTNRIDPEWGFARSDSQATRLSRLFGTTIRPFQPFSRDFATDLFETGRATTVNASVAGGTPFVTYMVAGRYYNEDGPFTADRYNFQNLGVNSADIARKYQGTLNLGLNPTSRLRLDIRALYADSHNEVPENNNSIYSPYTVALFSKPERANCDSSRVGATQAEKLADPTQGVAGVGRCVGAGNPTGASTFGTLRELLQRSIKQDARHFNAVMRAGYQPLISLRFDGSLGIDYTHQRSTSFLPFGNNIDRRTAQANEGDKSVDDLGHQELTLSGTTNWTVDVTPRINSTLLAGAQGFLTRTNDESSNNQRFPGPGIEIVSGGASPRVFEVFTQVVNAGYFAEERVGFDNWLFGTVGARYDYNSAFGEAAGGVLYPKASLSVIPSDWGGWQSSRLASGLSTLRFRGAIGKAGRQPGAFDKLTTYQALASSLGGGLVPANLGNPDLKPEISTEWEVGTELGFLRNTYSVEFTRWQRVLRDALVNVQFPPTGGFRGLQLANVGQMDAWGWEAIVKGFVVNRPNVSVDLFGNTAFIKQVVTSLGGAPELKVGGSYPRYRNFITPGMPPGALLGAKVVGPCAAGATKTAGGGVCLQPGQVPFDTNKDGVPDSQQQFLDTLRKHPFDPNNANAINFVDPMAADDDNDGNRLDHYLGKPYPDFQGSFGGTVTLLRNWRINTLFEYRAGRYTITNLTAGFRQANNANGGNSQRRAEVEALLLNPASTPEQKLQAANAWAHELRALTPYDGLNQNSPGDFIRWREIGLTYTTPTALAQRLGASDLAITLAARNLVLWTKYNGPDPEVNVFGRIGSGGGTDLNFGEGIDAFGFPIPRRFAVTVRAGF